MKREFAKNVRDAYELRSGMRPKGRSAQELLPFAKRLGILNDVERQLLSERGDVTPQMLERSREALQSVKSALT